MSPFAKLIDPASAAELRSCAGAKRQGKGWSFPGQQGLVLSPQLLLTAALTRIAQNEPPVGGIFAQGVAERLKKGEDAQQIARDLLAMID